MTTTNVIAIDGPSGSGKSTVSKLIARKTGLQYIDTGAMYRALTYKLRSKEIPLSDSGLLGALLEETTFEYKNGKLWMDGKIVGDEIRGPEIDSLVSEVSANSMVRDALAKKQIQIGKTAPSVIDGRDIGSVLFPEAILKIYLTANPKARAKRRFMQNKRRGIETLSVEEIENQIRKRDLYDSTRKNSPLKKAPDALEIDTSRITVDEAVQQIIALYQERLENDHV